MTAAPTAICFPAGLAALVICVALATAVTAGESFARETVQVHTEGEEGGSSVVTITRGAGAYHPLRAYRPHRWHPRPRRWLRQRRQPSVSAIKRRERWR